jgi:hypothetical protein
VECHRQLGNERLPDRSGCPGDCDGLDFLSDRLGILERKEVSSSSIVAIFARMGTHDPRCVVKKELAFAGGAAGTGVGNEGNENEGSSNFGNWNCICRGTEVECRVETLTRKLSF